MKRNTQSTKASLIMAGVVWLAALWFSALLAQTYEKGMNLFRIIEGMGTAINNPLHITWTAQTPRFLFGGSVAYLFAVLLYLSSRKNKRPGEEHGSAKWGDASSINRKYRGKKYILKRIFRWLAMVTLSMFLKQGSPALTKLQRKVEREPEIILTQRVRLGMDTRKRRKRYRRNLNILVVGGSGAGKTLFFAEPNIMQANCSYIVTDPKGELLRNTGPLLKAQGFVVKVLDLINFTSSFGYNPFVYVRKDSDILKLITNLIRNTTPKGSNTNDPFWEKAETALLTALMLYLWHEAPAYEQNWPMVMEMLDYAEVKEEDADAESPLDILFRQLAMKDKSHIAVRYYRRFKQAAGKTAKSILISVGVRLGSFMIPEIAKIMRYDELDIGSMGEKKTALFCLIPDNDTTFNFLVGMLYTQAFQELYYKADHEHGGRLPVHVRLIMDEFANVALPDDFDKAESTMRSREISANIIIQNEAQLKAIFKDSWESIIGNCDTTLYLGGNERSTHKGMSELLGKETIDTNTYGRTRGRQGSSSINDQQSGRELLTPDEVRLLDNETALLFIRGERPVLDRKYDIWKHPRIKLVPQGGAAPYDYTKDRGSISEYRFKTYKGIDATQDFDFIDSEDLPHEDAS